MVLWILRPERHLEHHRFPQKTQLLYCASNLGAILSAVVIIWDSNGLHGCRHEKYSFSFRTRVKTPLSTTPWPIWRLTPSKSSLQIYPLVLPSTFTSQDKSTLHRLVAGLPIIFCILIWKQLGPLWLSQQRSECISSIPSSSRRRWCHREQPYLWEDHWSALRKKMKRTVSMRNELDQIPDTSES